MRADPSTCSLPTRLQTAGAFSTAVAVAGLAMATSCTDVRQLTQPSCSYAVAGPTQAFGANGGTGTLTVTAPGVCPWDATADSSWIAFSGEPKGTGTGSVGFAVSVNLAPVSRAANVTIADKTIVVTQSAGACSFAVSPEAVSAGAGATTVAVTVTTASSCEWSVASNQNWIVPAGAGGAGNGTVSVAIAANGSSNGRTGTLTVAGKAISVNQGGAVTAACTVTLSPASTLFAAAGGSGSFEVTAGSGCGWSIAASVSWISISGPVNGSGSRTTQYAVAANPGPGPRTGHLTVGSQSLTVTQTAPAPACSYQVTPTSASFAAAGGTGTVAVTAQNGCDWTAMSDVSWITVSSPAGGKGAGSVSYAVAATTATTNRTGHLSVNGRTVTVTQSGVTCTYAVSPASPTFDEDAQSGAITVDTQPGCAWTAVSSAGWITIATPDRSGTGDATIDYSLAENKSRNDRTATITVGGQVVTVTQEGK